MFVCLDYIIPKERPIEYLHPFCFILTTKPISNIIQWKDNPKATVTVNNLNGHLKELKVHLIDNVNISGECLGRKGLHLNSKGNGKFAINLIHKICSLNER